MAEALPPRQLPRLRQVRVLRVQDLTPSMRRITFGGDDLADFSSAGFDDHLKLVLPPDAPLSDGQRPPMRDYTPRRFDTAARELDIEFAMHGRGPADRFARQAEPGQTAAVAGPRKSIPIPMDFDWHLLIGDESALPAIARRLEELPPGSRVIVLAAVAGAAHQPPLRVHAATQLHWLHRDSAGPGQDLAAATALLQLPPGHGHAWAAGEAAEMAAVRRELAGRHALDKRQLRVAAYWKRGAAAHHAAIED